MKYIRTKYQILKVRQTHYYKDKTVAYYELAKNEYGKPFTVSPYEIVKEANNIVKLSDELVIKYKGEEKPRTVNMADLLKSGKSGLIVFKKHIKWLFENNKDRLEFCNLGIWTDKGLIYVAKMNDKGGLELL